MKTEQLMTFVSEANQHTKSSSDIGKTTINCSIVSSLDPLTQGLRTAVSQRYNNPPKFVRYKIKSERLSYPANLGHYYLGLPTVPLAAAKLFTEAAFPMKANEECSLVHSFFWSAQRYDLPWIHENDQALGNYFSDYVHFEGSLMRGIVYLSSTRLNSPNCKAVIVWSNWAREGYIKDGVERTKIHVLPPPFVPPFHTKKKREHDSDGSRTILFIGRDYVRKEGDIVFQVFSNLKKSYDRLRLVYVGKVQDRTILKQLREDKHVAQYDYVSKDFLHNEILPNADMFLLPTRSEAYGMSIIEAMSNGIPPVTSRISAIPETVEDGRSGYLCTEGDVDFFTKKCAALLDDQDTRDEMGENAKRVIEEKLSPTKIGDELYEIYSNVLNS